ncbi:glycosyl transferase [Pseudoalteromonas sp. S3776]|nr:glycosyl transferase [Pseudoalteromonas sp. S3776]
MICTFHLEPRISNLEPRTSNLEPRTSNIKSHQLPHHKRNSKTH